MLDKFKFCPQCKNRLRVVNRRALDCQNCRFHFYISPATTNAVILVNNKNEILLTKRRFPPKKSYWDLPGGFVEFGETVEQSVIREIKEELGLTIKHGDLRYLGSYWSYYPYKGIRYQTLCFAFIAKYQGEKITTNDDVIEYRFYSKHQIPFNKLSFTDIKSALKDYISRG